MIPHRTAPIRARRALLLPLTGASIAFALMLTGCATEEEAPSPEVTSVDAEATESPSLEPEAAEDEASPDAAYGAQGALAATDLTLEDMLAFAAEDEYIARREYQEIMATFDVQSPYANIMRSEESHLDLLRGIYEARGEAFPADTSAEHLVMPTSLREAARHGVQAEIDNIAMYDRFLEYDHPADVAAVFTELRNGSVNHLQAFEAQVARLS